MLVRFLMGVIALCVVSTAASAAIDCRIRSMPPASFVAKQVPDNVRYKGMPLADLQKLYRRMAGLPKRAAGLDYCSDPLGFVYPWDGKGRPTIYYPTDVTDRCEAEVIQHEEAHVKGWAINHPGGNLQSGPCKGGKASNVS